jgi:hypothetical protein
LLLISEITPLKMSQIGFENASFHYENELMPTNEARIVRFHVPESMEEENELCEKIKAIEDIEDTVDEVHFLYNAIDIAVHGIISNSTSKHEL